MLALAERPAAYSESALASLWSRAHTLADALVTEGGRRLRVIYTGRKSSGAGPDFRDAVLLNEDGSTLTGDIELHTSAPGWYHHGHQTDANYNGVVLHVVFSSKGHTSTRLQSGIDAPVAAIQTVASNLESADDYASPGIPALEELRQSADIGTTLDAAGDARFLAKSHGFLLEIRELGVDETLYQGLMEALGYSTNRKPFRELARRVPYRALAALRDEPQSVRLLALKAMLLGASGLMHLVREVEEREQLRLMQKRLPKVMPIAKRHWHLFRVRPPNHPVRRITGAAYLLDTCLDAGLNEILIDTLDNGGISQLNARIEQRPHIGKARACDIVVIVALPCLHAYGNTRGDDSLVQAVRDAYAKAPKLQDNEITREMRRLCAIDKSVKLNARRQQGMIHIYRRAVRGRAK